MRETLWIVLPAVALAFTLAATWRAARLSAGPADPAGIVHGPITAAPPLSTGVGLYR
jgi:hypothetical protein